MYIGIRSTLFQGFKDRTTGKGFRRPVRENLGEVALRVHIHGQYAGGSGQEPGAEGRCRRLADAAFLDAEGDTGSHEYGLA